MVKTSQIHLKYRINTSLKFFTGTLLGLFTVALGLQGDSSTLHRWIDSEGNCTYGKLCPEDLKGPHPWKAEVDGKKEALMCGNLFPLNATVKYKEGFEHNLLQKNLKAPLAYFNSTSPKYSAIGMFILIESWAKGSNLGIISKVLHADSADHVQTVMDKTWKMQGLCDFI